ncbi:ATP phosphoribosyltransferase regulatory subunit [Oleomonas cavernae]|uniref:ATP phosphoribosyltransferase regulatory subunit n=1 Tax=Oleomonas cavernae TaxID=2320859 RepID=UPI0026D0A9D2
MTEYAARALLPEGLHDELPPAAEHEASVVGELVASFAAHGYQRVKPPLIEFEESLTTGPGAAQATGMFRLIDPVSQRMMAVRSDMTVQVARIAATRLRKAPRPLRLSYAGQVLRVKGSQLRPERQFPQAGVELIGVKSVAADAEVVLLAIEALTATGHPRPITVDLTLPTLVPAIAAALGLDDSVARQARDALDGKDAAQLQDIPGEAGVLFRGLLDAAGPADRALQRLGTLALPPAARAEVDELAGLVAAVRAAGPSIALTIDPGEYRAHEYHTGFGFTLFAAGVRASWAGAAAICWSGPMAGPRRRSALPSMWTRCCAPCPSRRGRPSSICPRVSRRMRRGTCARPGIVRSRGWSPRSTRRRKPGGSAAAISISTARCGPSPPDPRRHSSKDRERPWPMLR